MRGKPENVLVVAVHPDDETLGGAHCSDTKQKAIIFNGSSSQPPQRTEDFPENL